MITPEIAMRLLTKLTEVRVDVNAAQEELTIAKNVADYQSRSQFSISTENDKLRKVEA
jgi:hypothetical protein